MENISPFNSRSPPHRKILPLKESPEKYQHSQRNKNSTKNEGKVIVWNLSAFSCIFFPNIFYLHIFAPPNAELRPSERDQRLKKAFPSSKDPLVQYSELQRNMMWAKATEARKHQNTDRITWRWLRRGRLFLELAELIPHLGGLLILGSLDVPLHCQPQGAVGTQALQHFFLAIDNQWIMISHHSEMTSSEFKKKHNNGQFEAP